MDIEITGSKLWMISFYREQLRKFNKVGLGNLTEHDVKVTDKLIAITRKRLDDLTIVFEKTGTAKTIRKRKAERKIFNGQQSIHNNGTTIASRMQDNGNTRYARKKS
mgnify:CR=1 FL=1